MIILGGRNEFLEICLGSFKDSCAGAEMRKIVIDKHLLF